MCWGGWRRPRLLSRAREHTGTHARSCFFHFTQVHENFIAVYHIADFTDAPSSTRLRLPSSFDKVVRRNTAAAEDSQPLAPVPDHADDSRGMSFRTAHLCS